MNISSFIMVNIQSPIMNQNHDFSIIHFCLDLDCSIRDEAIICAVILIKIIFKERSSVLVIT